MIPINRNLLRRLLGRATASLQKLWGADRRLDSLTAIALIIFIVWLPTLLVKIGLITDFVFLGGYEADLVALLSVLSLVGTGVVILGVYFAGRTNAMIRRVQQAERLQQATNRRDFLRRLDHEMKNPLTTLRIGLLNMQQSLGEDQIAQQESLYRMVQQTQRLQRLIEDLRYVTEIEEYPIERIAVDLRGVLEEAIALVCNDSEHAKRSIDLQVQQIPWPLPHIYADPELLVIVFRNLLDNALKYTLPQGKVIVRTTEDGRMALVEVVDTGIGIPGDDLDHVFDDLYRAQNAVGLSGSGLGLAIVKGIINLHAGKVEINSRLDQGTVLRVWLPLAKGD